MSGALALFWRSVEPASSGRYLVKGTVLATAYAGPHKRFLIEEVRTREADGYAGCSWRVRDAHGVTDAEVREGKHSPVVFHGELDACLAFIAKA